MHAFMVGMLLLSCATSMCTTCVSDINFCVCVFVCVCDSFTHFKYLSITYYYHYSCTNNIRSLFIMFVCMYMYALIG